MYNGPQDVSGNVDGMSGSNLALGISRNDNTNVGKLMAQVVILAQFARSFEQPPGSSKSVQPLKVICDKGHAAYVHRS